MNKQPTRSTRPYQTHLQLHHILVIAVAALFIGQYLLIAINRIAYPYELEWMEGATVDTFARVLRGDLLYTAPSIDYVPPIYGPAYFYLGAAFPLLFGPTLFAVRFLSFIASLGIFILLLVWTRREGGSISAAAFACGLFAACFEVLGGWFDLARVDTTYLFCLLFGGYLLRFAASSRMLILSAVVLSIATLIKVNAGLVIIFLIPPVLLIHRKQAFAWLSTLAIIGGGVTALFTFISGEWFLYFVLARSQDAILLPSIWFELWTSDIASIWLPLLLAVIYIIRLARMKQLDAFRFYTYYALGMILASFLSRIHHGSWVNVNFSAYAVLILLAGLSLGHLVKAASRPIWSVGVAALIVLQFWGLVYDSRNHLPDEEDLAAGQMFINLLSEADGEVLLFAHGYYPRLANVPSPESGWFMNMIHGERTGAKEQFDASVADAIQARRFAAIITDNAIYLHENYFELLAESYDDHEIPTQGTAFFPVTGQATRPLHWWTPKSNSE